MYQNKSIGVVIPAYNEEKLISRVLTTMPDFVDRIIVVDDHSRDQTVELVKKVCQNDPRIILICHQKNQGVGGAIITGYQKIINEKIDVAVVVAGDGQMDYRDMPKIIDPVVSGKADYAKGNRLFRGESWSMIPHYRYLGNSFLSLLSKIASGYWHIADFQCGYTAISLKALKQLKLTSIYKRYGMPNDLLIKLNICNLDVEDVSVRPVYGQGEKSDIRLWKVIPTISWLLFRGFFERLWQKYVIRDSHPLVFFYIFGLLFFPLGFVYGLYLVFRRILDMRVAANSPLFAVFFFISGLQFLLFAMWFDMEYYNRKNK